MKMSVPEPVLSSPATCLHFPPTKHPSAHTFPSSPQKNSDVALSGGLGVSNVPFHTALIRCFRHIFLIIKIKI